MRIASSAFTEGATIPRRFTCDGENLSPPLEWSEAPAETRSFVLLCDDPDAPAGTWHHWAVYDIPAGHGGLGEGIRPDDNAVGQATNDFHRLGYGGPCPPRGHGAHRYCFRLLALSIDRVPPLAHNTCVAIEREARKHLLAEATLVGVYERR